MPFSAAFPNLFQATLTRQGPLFFLPDTDLSQSQVQTCDLFSKKWSLHEETNQDDLGKYNEMQENWYLDLYGFSDETGLKAFLQDKSVILDAGCGLGEKSAWLARLAPHATVIGMDYSDAVLSAAQKFTHLKNLFFVKGDIAHTQLKSGVVDYVNCDQVLHHTDNVEATFQELSRILSAKGEFACYVYAKKALPRELIDDYFRQKASSIPEEDMRHFSRQMAELGKKLEALNVEIEVEDIPLLQIKAGKYSIQRFIYWNFLKCYWNAALGMETSIVTNYDWYGPSNARRFSQEEFLDLADSNGLVPEFVHTEPACYTARFRHSQIA